MMQAQLAAKAKILFSLTVVLALLLALNRYLPRAPDLWVGLAMLAIASPISGLLFWRRKLKRSAFLDIYLNPSSYWHRCLRGGVLMLLLQFIIAVVLAAFLLVGLVRAEAAWFWLMLFGLIPVWVLTYDGFARYVSRHASRRYCRLMTDRTHGWTHAAALLLVILAWSMFQPVPDLGGASLDNAVRIFADQPRVESNVLQLGLIVTAVFAAVPNWLIQNYGGYIPGFFFKLLLWTLVLIREWLFVLPLMLLLQSVNLFVDGDLSRRAKEVRSDKPGR